MLKIYKIVGNYMLDILLDLSFMTLTSVCGKITLQLSQHGSSCHLFSVM